MRTVIKVSNITCSQCAKTIERFFATKDDVIAKVHVTAKKVIFDYNSAKTSVNDLVKGLQEIGYYPLITSIDQKKAKRRDLIDFIIATLCTIPLLWTMIGHFGGSDLVPEFLQNGYVQLAFVIPVEFFVGRRFFKAAYYQLSAKTAGMDVLVVIGTMAAFTYSLFLTINHQLHPTEMPPHLYFEAAAVIIYMVLIGNFFEARVKEKTASSLEAIMNLGVKEARVLVDGTETMLPLDQVKVGDIVVVLPQEKVPLDGRINDGASYLDEAMLNGESMPRFKTKDDVVLGATLNLTGRLIVTVTAVGAETVLAQIIKTVEDVALYKPKSQRIADKIASIFVPIIVVIAVLTFILQLSITKDSETAFKTAIAVLVVSCPCALGLATPTSIAVASGLAYRQGFLYKGGEFFEKAHRITAIAFDKTGTLTIGHPKVVNFVGDPASYRFTKSLEAHSNHPLASAIKAYQNDEILVVQDFEIIAGTGIKGQIMGNEVTIGSKRILDELQLTNPYPLEYDTDSKAGKTVIFTIINQKVVNMISLIDPLKDDAKALIKSLVARNIKPIMITGDQKDTAAYLALDLGIETVYAETLPHQKAKLIEEIRSTGNVVAFVGDGINDAPALKMADVGFVVSTGTDIALDSADVVLMKPDLNLVLQAIDLSKATLRSIYLNFFWAFVYNISLVPVAALGYLDPRLAGIGMGFSSIMVVLNALSLNLFNLRKKGEK